MKSRALLAVVLPSTLLGLSGCVPTTCGPGTVERDHVCVAISSDAGVSDLPDAEVDAAVDAGGGGDDAGDASAGSECGAADVEAICVTSTRRQRCGAESEEVCPEGYACVEQRLDGTTNAACVSTPAVLCDPSVDAARCDGDVATYCTEIDGVHVVNPRDCAAVGPGARCAVGDEGRPVCETRDCEGAETDVCESDARGVVCEFGRLLYSDCAEGTTCTEVHTTGPHAACIPDGAVASTSGPSNNPQPVRCLSDGRVVMERYGFEEAMPCPAAVVAEGGGFTSVATRCLERDGEVDCVRVDRTAACSDGWECDARSAACVDGGESVRFTCSGGCLSSTGHCYDAQRCDPDTFVEQRMGDDYICCQAEGGMGMTLVLDRPCPLPTD